MFYVSCYLSSPGTGNIAAAYTLRFAAANLVEIKLTSLGTLFLITQAPPPESPLPGRFLVTNDPAQNTL